MRCYVCNAPGDGDNANVCALHRPATKAALAECDAAFVALRDHVEFGPMPRGYVSALEMERLRGAKWLSADDADRGAAERAAYAYDRAFAHNCALTKKLDAEVSP